MFNTSLGIFSARHPARYGSSQLFPCFLGSNRPSLSRRLALSTRVCIEIASFSKSESDEQSVKEYHQNEEWLLKTLAKVHCRSLLNSFLYIARDTMAQIARKYANFSRAQDQRKSQQRVDMPLFEARWLFRMSSTTKHGIVIDPSKTLGALGLCEALSSAPRELELLIFENCLKRKWPSGVPLTSKEAWFMSQGRTPWQRYSGDKNSWK